MCSSSRHGGDDADGAVEDAGGALVVVVAQLGDLVPDPEDPAAVAAFRRAGAGRGQGVLEQLVEVPGAGRAAVHRAQHLHVAARVQAEPGRDPPRHDVDDEFGGLLGVVAAEPEEVAEPGQLRLLPGVDPVGVDHDAGLLGLAEDLGQPHRGQRPGGEQVAEDLPGADRGQLVDVADQQQVSARRDCLDQLVREDHVDHRGLVDHHQVRVEWLVGVEGGVAARPELQQAVDGGRVVAGEFGEPFGGPAGGGGEHDRGAFGAGEFDDGADGE